VWICSGFIVLWVVVAAVNRMQLHKPGQPVRAPATAAAPDLAALKTYLSDDADFLASGDHQRIEQELTNFERETSSQIAVAIYRHAPAIPVEEFTIRTAQLSQLGRAAHDNGAILFLFLDRRIARLEVGYGLESTLTDAVARRILDEKLAPALRGGNGADAIDSAVAAILDTIRADYQNTEKVTFLGYVKIAWRKTTMSLSKAAREVWPFLRTTTVGDRIAITFFGSLLGVGFWSAFVNAFRFLWSIARSAWNRLRGRPSRSGIGDIDFEPIWDTLKLAAFLIIMAGGGILMAGGGTFGGAGAQIFW
jgi:uncharacterized membrane protein YgcG